MRPHPQRAPTSEPVVGSPARRTVSLLRVYSGRLVAAAAIGAVLGLLQHLDAMMVGGYDELAAVSTIEPVRGFAWNVGGTAVLAMGVYAVGAIINAINLMRTEAKRARDRARRTAAREPIADYDHDHPERWSPERRRRAFRVLSGGRHD